MNRIASRSYSNIPNSNPPTPEAPTVTYCYDGNTSGACATAPDPANCNLKLHLTMVSSSASVSDTSCYDQFGMPLASSQITAGTTYSLSYTYNMLSEITSETYPSGRVVSTGYDSAGRATSVTGQGVQNYTLPSTSYASAVTYAPNGAVSAMTLGNTLVQANGFNTRFQPASVTLGSVWSTSLYYCGSHLASCSTNNGNLQEQDFTSQGVSYVQDYAYDALNRISSVGEDANSSFSWSQTFLYDSFGNRAVNPGYPAAATVNPVWTATATSQFNSNNQFIRGTGDKYDGAGNEISVASSSAPNMASNTMTYDGENRMVSANFAGMGTVNYTYDGDGRRVTKSTPATTVYVYDAAGRMATEYPGVAPEATGTVYLTGDHLGSTRLVTSAANTLVNGVSPGAAGSVVKCYDYMPFGEDSPSGVGSRGSCYPSGLYPATPDVLSVKFTGKERDAESGLDWFNTRYMSSAQGRFTSPDQPIIDQFPQDPQSWNMYSYGRNNPLKYTDPTGQAVQVCTNDESGKQTCVVMSDPQYAAAIAGNNPGINAPAAGANAGPGGGLAVGGAITCGGVVCGSATYQEESMQDTTGDLVAIAQIGASLPSLVRGGASLGQSLARGIAGLFSKEAGAVAKATVQDILQGALREGGSRTEIFSKPGGFAQATKDFESLEGSAQTVGPVRIKDLPNGQGRAVLRNFSSDGRPTLEIQPAGGGYKGTAIRYNP
jgi:RHS repeat-associated protein